MLSSIGWTTFWHVGLGADCDACHQAKSLGSNPVKRTFKVQLDQGDAGEPCVMSLTVGRRQIAQDGAMMVMEGST
jgi:hypothetical protein